MLRLLIGVFRALLRTQASLEAGIVTLRHQVAVLRRHLNRQWFAHRFGGSTPPRAVLRPVAAFRREDLS